MQQSVKLIWQRSLSREQRFYLVKRSKLKLLEKFRILEQFDYG